MSHEVLRIIENELILQLSLLEIIFSSEIELPHLLIIFCVDVHTSIDTIAGEKDTVKCEDSHSG